MKTRLFIYLVFSCSFLQSQDLRFPYANQSLLAVNPSFAGSSGFIRNQSVAQRQNIGYTGSPSNYNSATDIYFSKIKSGFSLSGSQVSIGPMQESALYLGYAQYLSCFNKKLKIIPSIQLGYRQKVINSDWIMPNGSVQNNNYFQKIFPDVNAGLLLNYKNLYIGYSVFNLRENHLAGSLLLGTNNLHASYNWNVCRQLKLNFSLLSQSSLMPNHMQLAVKALLFKHYIIGVGFQHDNSPFLAAGFRADYFSLQASYYRSVSKRAEFNRGNMQLSLSINMAKKEDRALLTNFENW